MNLPATQSAALDALTRRALSHHRARARALGQSLDYTAADLVQLVETSPLCRWCRLPVGFQDMQIDHLDPLGRGGQHQLHNLAVACSRCNLLRGQMSQAATLELLEMLGGWHPLDADDLSRRAIAGGRRYARRRAR